MEIITGYTGTPHITAEQDRDVNKGIFGEESYVLRTGSELEAELVSNNELKIRDGVIMHQGCAASIKKNTYDPIVITNGSQGMKRIDLVVARYTRNSETKVESVDLKILQGTPTSYTPSAPAYVVGDIQAGDLVSDMPLYKITLNGLNVTSVEKMFSVIDGLTELNSKLKNAETTMSNNLKSLLSVKQVTVKSNINVGAGKDFECYIKAPTVSGYTPVGIIGYDLVGNWDVWINVSSCYYNSGSNLIYTKGHNFGTGACNALLNAIVLYKKN